MTNDHHTPESKCLHCGKILDMAGSPDGSPIDRPSDGDITVCIRCGAVMAFDGEGKVRGMTDEEIATVTRDAELMSSIARTVRSIRIVRAGMN